MIDIDDSSYLIKIIAPQKIQHLIETLENEKISHDPNLLSIENQERKLHTKKYIK